MGEKSGLEKLNKCPQNSCRLRGNKSIHLKACKQPAKVISEALVTIFENLQEYSKATEGWRTIMPHLPLWKGKKKNKGGRRLKLIDR